MASELCPKCEQPRLPDSADCPWCGIVYDRYRGPRPEGAAGAGAGPDRPPPTPPPATPPPTTPPPAAVTTPALSHLPDVYDGPAPGDAAQGRATPARPGASPLAVDGPVEHEETFLTRNLGLSLMVVLLLAVALYGFWSRQVFGLWDNPEVVRQGYSRLTGFTAPEELEEGMLWSLAGRKLVVLEETGVPEDELGLSAIVFHPGSFGGRPGAEELLRGVEERIRGLGIPHVPVGERPAEVHGAPARTRTWDLGDGRRTFGRITAVAFQAPDGRTALLVVAGPSGRVARVMRGVVL